MNSRARVELGKLGERIAAEYLSGKGLRIEGRNCRIGHSDIDILARDGDTLVFVEVRTKIKTDRGMPEDTFTFGKLKRMKQTAAGYLARYEIDGPARLDAICLVLDFQGGIRHLKHYEGVG
ncbi:MAG: YraN family protein [Spirochaetales bacterium]|nr:YraN family protein [Spirochaetales bacterium]